MPGCARVPRPETMLENSGTAYLLSRRVLRGDPRSGRGQRLDLNPELRIDEAFHLHQGTGRGPAAGDALVADRPEGPGPGPISTMGPVNATAWLHPFTGGSPSGLT